MDVHLTMSLSRVMYSYSWLEILSFPLESDINYVGLCPLLADLFYHCWPVRAVSMSWLCR